MRRPINPFGGVRHVVWDWNGTLLDDHHLVVEAFNAVLSSIGGPRIDDEFYRDHFRRPLRHMYEVALERPVRPEEWPRFDAGFHAAYEAGEHDLELAPGAETALTLLLRNGALASQSLLSMARHHHLSAQLERYGIGGAFDLVDGQLQPDDGSKTARLTRHLETLDVDDPSTVVVIGDAIDDAHAATANGARVVLYDGGSHHLDDLRATGHPVAGSLTEVLEILAG
ncbi:MAG TPA: HAD family hydrolase [Acidimicrobiales bacterium]|nr:HAD family hydrolase [Acidimicrobiales bacterium]